MLYRARFTLRTRVLLIPEHPSLGGSACDQESGVDRRGPQHSAVTCGNALSARHQNRPLDIIFGLEFAPPRISVLLLNYFPPLNNTARS